MKFSYVVYKTSCSSTRHGLHVMESLKRWIGCFYNFISALLTGVFGCPTTVANVETVAVAPVCQILILFTLRGNVLGKSECVNYVVKLTNLKDHTYACVGSWSGVLVRALSSHPHGWGLKLQWWQHYWDILTFPPPPPPPITKLILPGNSSFLPTNNVRWGGSFVLTRWPKCLTILEQILNTPLLLKCLKDFCWRL